MKGDRQDSVMDIRNFSMPPKELIGFLNLIDSYVTNTKAFNRSVWTRERNIFMKCYSSIYSAWYPNAKHYSDEHVAGQIFKQQMKSKDLRSYYQYQMFACRKTLDQ